LQCVTYECRAMKERAENLRCNVLQCVAACCSVLQCVAVSCGVLQCVACECGAIKELYTHINYMAHKEHLCMTYISMYHICNI